MESFSQTSSSKSSILPPKFRLKPLKIPSPSSFTSHEKSQLSTATTYRVFPSNGLPSPAATVSFKRPSSPLVFSKRLRLTCKNIADLQNSVPSALTTPNTTSYEFASSNLYHQYTSFENNCIVKENKDVGTAGTVPDTKIRALQMIRWAISCNSNLKNDYIPVSILGWGGCGAVFEAKREVAIKIMYKSTKRAGIPAEIDILSSLTHHSIVQYLGYFEDKRAWYLIMERFGKIWKSPQDVEKECFALSNSFLLEKHIYSATDTTSSLFEYIDHSKGGKVPQRSLRPLFKQICQAISFLHNQNIIHGDLKEENILIGNIKGRLVAKLCDFGHSYRVDEKNPKMRLYGTRVITPPEMLNHLRCEEKGEKCSDILQLGLKQDIWALGIVFWTMLHGTLPAENEMYINGEFDLSKFNYYPTDFSAIQNTECLDLLKNMLCVDPQKRLSAIEVLKHPYFKN